jgi:hypothetical protein
MAILSALAIIGFLIWAVRTWRNRQSFPRWQWAAGSLLAVLGLLALASYIWYNLQFVQHQGRYLFTALVPISLAVALGWRETLRRERVWPLASFLLAGTVVLKLAGLLPNWPLLMLVVTATALAVRRFLPPRLDPFVQACPYALLIFFDLASLYLYIIPQLAL